MLDHLSSKAKYTYDAWGNHKIHYLEGTNFVAINSNVCYNSSDPVNKQIATLNPFRYRGYYFDCETGLYYLNSRYYDPEIGRFINADDISVLDLTNVAINGLNLYAYCLNNPVNEVDENGYFVWWIAAIVAIAATAGIAAGVSILTQGITKGFGNISLLQVLFDGLMGALSGLLMVTGFGPLGMALWNGALGFIGSIGSQMIGGASQINFFEAVVAGVLNLGFNIKGMGGARNRNYLDLQLRNSEEFLKAEDKLFKVVTKISRGGYKSYKSMCNAINSKTKLFLNRMEEVDNASISNAFYKSIITSSYIYGGQMAYNVYISLIRRIWG